MGFDENTNVTLGKTVANLLNDVRDAHVNKTLASYVEMVQATDMRLIRAVRFFAETYFNFKVTVSQDANLCVALHFEKHAFSELHIRDLHWTSVANSLSVQDESMLGRSRRVIRDVISTFNRQSDATRTRSVDYCIELDGDEWTWEPTARATFDYMFKFSEAVGLLCYAPVQKYGWVKLVFFYPYHVTPPFPRLSELKDQTDQQHMSTSSSSSSSIPSISLDDDFDEVKQSSSATPDDAKANEATDPALEAFSKLSTRVLVGTEKLSMPLSVPHMLQNSAFWRRAVENGEEAPTHIMTDMRVTDKDIDFQNAWLRVNGLNSPPLTDGGNKYLDYLMFTVPGESDISTQKRKLVFQLNETYKKRAEVFNGEADALRIAKAYHDKLQQQKSPGVLFDLSDESPMVRKRLADMGFRVEQRSYNRFELIWDPKNSDDLESARKRRRVETPADIDPGSHRYEALVDRPVQKTKGIAFAQVMCSQCNRTISQCVCTVDAK